MSCKFLHKRWFINDCAYDEDTAVIILVTTVVGGGLQYGASICTRDGLNIIVPIRKKYGNFTGSSK